MPVSRRDLIRWSTLGVGAAPIAGWLASCSSSTAESVPTSPRSASAASTSVEATSSPATTPELPAAQLPPAVTTTTTSHSPPTTAAVDPSRPWWMQGNYGPVADEVESVNMTVRGSIPPELSGLYVRNGSNPSSGDSPHWFFGDGMAHGVRLSNGRAEWYRNRYVKTPLYDGGLGFGAGPPGGASNQSNVSCIWHGGRLLTSGEVGLPYSLDPADLSTVGPYDFAGKLTTSFTAHPKIDPVTGRMHSFGYGFTPPFLTYHITEADGSLVHSEVVDIPRSTMIHDFAITETDAVFWDLPVVFDLDAAIAFIGDSTSTAFPYRWDPSAGARVGVMPLTGGAAAIQWFDIEPCYVFHGVNAFRRGNEVIVDVCHLSSIFVPGDIFAGTPSLRRWSFDTATGKSTEDVLATEQSGDLPSRDPRRLGREHRYGYLASTRDNPLTVDLGGLIKHDYLTGSREVWDPGPTSHSGEWLFVPAGRDPADDAGYLLSYVHDEAAGRTELVIIDASDVPSGPIAWIEIPQRVPYGFHAAWVPV